MQVLTGKFPAHLAPSSQEGGNMIQPTLPQNAMTAPGSLPVTPLPPPVQGVSPEINFSNDAAQTKTPLGNPMAVNHPPNEGEHANVPASKTGYHGWTHADGTPYPDGRATWHRV